MYATPVSEKSSKHENYEIYEALYMRMLRKIPHDQFVILSLSGGKNSTALLHLHHREIDVCVNVDTGREFPEVTALIDELSFIYTDILFIRYVYTREEFDAHAKSEYTRGKFKYQQIGVPKNFKFCWLRGKTKSSLNETWGEEIQYVGFTADEERPLKGDNIRTPLQTRGRGMSDDGTLTTCFRFGSFILPYLLFHRTGCIDCLYQSPINYNKAMQFYPEFFEKEKGLIMKPLYT